MRRIKFVGILLILSMLVLLINTNSTFAGSCDDAKKTLDEATEKYYELKGDNTHNVIQSLLTGGIALLTSLDKEASDVDKHNAGKDFAKEEAERLREKKDLEAAEQAYEDAKKAYYACLRENSRCGGCGQIPSHALHATCWNSGCNASSVRICTHDCSYAPVVCSQRVSGSYCIIESSSSAPTGAKGHSDHSVYHASCRTTYNRCYRPDLDSHRQWKNCTRVRYRMVSGKQVKQTCGASYLECSNKNGQCFGGDGDSNESHL